MFIKLINYDVRRPFDLKIDHQSVALSVVLFIIIIVVVNF